MNCTAIIVASGSSRRMGFDKLTATLAGRPVLQWSVDAFLATPGIAEIIVVTTPERFQLLQFPAHSTIPVRRVDGGSERRDSVTNGIAAADPEASHFAVHDGARPLVTPATITACLAAAAQHGAAALARRATETMMRAGPDRFTRSLVDRSDLWLMETPQVFRSRILHRACQFARDHHEPVTDEVSAVNLLGISTFLVETHSPNLKITSPGDLETAAALVRTP